VRHPRPSAALTGAVRVGLGAAALVVLLARAGAHEPEETPDETTAPVLIEHVEPPYPEAARRAGVGGTVGLELSVGADGAVAAARVTRPAGFGFDEAALAAAQRFRFRPATRGGHPIAATVLFDQRFVVRPHLSAEAVAGEPEPPGTPTATSPPAPVYESTVVSRGPTSAASASTIRNLDFELRPKSSPNDLLRVVPGLLTAQHQGGGKADQLFLRGFDADHGTDVGILLDGIPINLPSHAHGQGFADLHFLIPEAILQIDVVKGPYDVRFGDFSTGGAVNLVTRTQFESSSVALTVGGFPTEGCSGGITGCKLVAQERLVGIVAPRFDSVPRLHPWLAVELARDDGPFDAPERLTRYNLFGKLSYDVTPQTSVGLLVEAYGSGWNGSGQIPSREVDAGRLSPFGAIDPSEGGLTERQMVSAFLHHRDPRHEVDVTAYVTRYRLSLWNDFTFFLVDPVNGDEIEQDDARVVSGATLSYHLHTRWRSISFRTTVGAQLRYDGIHVDVWNVSSQNGDFRKRLRRRVDGASGYHFGSDDDIDELNLAAYAEEDVVWTRWLRSIVGLRADYFGFNVDDHGETLGAGAAAASGTRQKTLLSPKATVVFSPLRFLDIYLNLGMGFHSNDARIAVQEGQRTPDGAVVNVVPRIYGGEIGLRGSWRHYLSAAVALWASYLENETVFSGDDAAFVPSDPTRRLGVDVELRAQPTSWLYIDFDLAQASSQAVPDHGNGGAIALAPRLYLTGGLSARWRGLRAGIRLRYLGARPAFDESSATYAQLDPSAPRRVNTEPYLIFDLYGAYRWHWLEAAFSIQNLFDSEWREAQFGNRSCTRDEVSNPLNPNFSVCGASLPVAQRTGVPDVHFTAGTPFDLQLTLRAYF
jgi:TonB family protein